MKNQTGLLALTAILTASSALYATAQDDGTAANANQIPLSSFASGQSFYIQKDSFKPVGNGKLQYQVTGDLADGNQRISINEIDCNTGQYQSPVQSWQQDARGQVSNETPGPVTPMMVRNRTRLYDTLKSACQEFSPDTPANW